MTIPEGPELSRSRDHLNQLVRGKLLDSFAVVGGRYRESLPDGLEEFCEFHKSAAIKLVEVSVKGKFMYWTLEPQVPFIGPEDVWYLWCTYGMSGQWTLKRPDKHTVATAWFEAPTLAINFHDPRHFGTLKFVRGRAALRKKLATLGPDMLNSPPTTLEFGVRLNKRHDRTIAEALMDQSVVSGVGNYVKAESLYLAEISPHRIVNTLTGPEREHLRQQIINVMKASYDTGGATISTYRQVDGSKGGAQSRFLVYGNKMDPLGNPVVKEETLDGRTTHWCPSVQR